tara:strand:- start:5 stop:844 length:840 start_codon:yes stop_codon:yes gene_type:complete
MGKKSKVSSRRIGLEIELAIGRFFLDTEDLHYGYWPEKKVTSVQSFKKAQEAHSNLIIKHIPKETKRILDVGSGSGNLALQLINQGFQVDCVIPSEFLAEQVKAKLGDRSHIHICGFEQIDESNKYDLVLFSESFQYVKLVKSLEKISNMVNFGGHLLICDFFKRDVEGKSPLGGGHAWNTFQSKISSHPLQLITDIDITAETAPTIDLLAKFNKEVLAPVASMSGEYLIDHYPKLSRLFKWKFRNRLNKIHNIYLSGAVNGESFQQYKEYHLLVYKKV